MLVTIAVLIATVLAAVGLVPQVMKLIRTGIPDGVSPTWAIFGVVTNAAWIVYLWSQALWLALPSVVMIVAAYGITFALLAGLGTGTRRALLLGSAWATFLAMYGGLLGWVGLGTILGFSYAVQVAPGVWTAYRTLRPAGIAPATWIIAFVEGILWGYYGWWHGDTPLIMFAVTATVASIAMLARYWATRGRAATAAGAGPALKLPLAHR